jgi:hypothetical protein
VVHVRTAKPAPARGVKGTAQLAGDNGTIGTTYTIGQEAPWNFTLNRAELTVHRVNIGENTYSPAAGEKLLVLTYTVQNPNPSEQDYYWASLRFSVVDATNVTREYVQNVGQTGSREALTMTLKPAQKVEAYTVITVPAQGTVPKLIVEHPAGGRVLRYDLRAQIKGLTASLADPADATGTTALQEVPAESGSFYPLRNFDAKLVSAAYTTKSLAGLEPEEGQQFFVATFTIKNMSSTPAQYYWSTFTATLVASDGEKTEYNQNLLKGARDESAEGELAPGAEYNVRVFFALPRDVSAKTLYFAEGDSRVYAFDVSKMKG